MLQELLDQIPDDQPIGHGWKTHPAPRPGMTFFAPPVALAGRSGGAGAATTGEAWSRQGCDASKLLGERVMACDFDRQVAELQIRAAILNRFTALGTPKTHRGGWVRSTEGETRPHDDLCNRARMTYACNAPSSSFSRHRRPAKLCQTPHNGFKFLILTDSTQS